MTWLLLRDGLYILYTPHRQTVTSASPGSAPRPPPHRVCPKHLPKNASSRHPDQMPEPPQLTDLELQLRGGKYHAVMSGVRGQNGNSGCRPQRSNGNSNNLSLLQARLNTSSLAASVYFIKWSVSISTGKT